MILGMLYTITIWLLIFISFSGIGMIVLKTIFRTKLNFERIIVCFLIGFTLIIITLQFIHLFIPINRYVGIVLIIFGIISFIWNIDEVYNSIKQSVFRSKSVLFGSVVFLIWYSNRALGPIQSYDAGLYHIQAIRWISSFSIIPGLGNLHSRLAFNSSYFPYLALLNFGSKQFLSHHFGGSILILVSLISVSLGILRVIKNRSECLFCDYFRISFLIPIAHHVFIDTSSTSTDLPIYILAFFVALYLAEILFQQDRKSEDLQLNIFMIITLSILGITIKLSFLAFAFGSLVVLVYGYNKIFNKNCFLGQKPLNWILIIGLPFVALSSWIVRGVITSGYIAYPLTVGSLDVDWRVSEKQAIVEAKGIRSWSRYPVRGESYDEVLKDWDWFDHWVQYILEDHRFIIDFLIPCLILFFLIIAILLFTKHRGDIYRLLIFLFPPFISLIYWFFTAPGPRFIGANVWIICGGVLSWFVINTIPNGYTKRTIIYSLPIVVIIVLVNFIFYGLFVNTGSSLGFNPLPETNIFIFETNTGLKLFVPEEGDQCWDGRLPCTPFPNSKLQLRNEGNYRDGFILGD